MPQVDLALSLMIFAPARVPDIVISIGFSRIARSVAQRSRSKPRVSNGTLNTWCTKTIYHHSTDVPVEIIFKKSRDSMQRLNKKTKIFRIVRFCCASNTNDKFKQAFAHHSHYYKNCEEKFRYEKFRIRTFVE